MSAGFDYYVDQVLPAVYARCDALFPEFGFRKLGSGAWQGAKKPSSECPLGVRNDRVFVKMWQGRYPAGFGVAGGSLYTFLGYLSGDIYGNPRGSDFFKWAAELARRAGVEPGPLAGEGSAKADPEVMRKARAQLERQRRREEAKARKRSEQKIARARELWEQAAQGHPAIATYLRARGVDVEALGGDDAVPRSLRFMAECPVGDAKKKAAPAIVACVALCGRAQDGRETNHIAGIHRLYLKPDFSGIDPDLGKMMLGAVRGGCVRLGMPAGAVGHVVIAGDFDDPTIRDEAGRMPLRGQQAAERAAERLVDLFGGGHRLEAGATEHRAPSTEHSGAGHSVLCLCEGIETGMAIRAATGWPVWACLSASGLMGLEVPASLISPGVHVSVACPGRWAPEEWRAAAQQGAAA